jgi:predicted ATP-grasp superfamily ATP-dependent carboligase
MPSREAFATASDKGATLALADELGVPRPQTFEPSSVEELLELLREQPAEELVLKPRSGSGSSGLIYGTDIRSTSIRGHWERHGPLLLQERIPRDGTAYGVSLLFDRDAGLRAEFTHRRLREYPVSGGPSTQRVSATHGELRAHSVRLLEALEWSGVAMVEWKLHPVGDRPMLLEINPRFWGSLALAVRAGVDFPTLYADLALGRPVPATPPTYPDGVLSRWMIPGDILRYATSPAAEREQLREFVRGSIRDAEEWDRHDLRGSIACALCPALLLADPRYWRYLRSR